MAVTYSSGSNYHSIADDAGMTLPNGDWSLITIIRPGSDVTSGQDIISNRQWGTANSFNLYITSGFLATQIDAGAINVDISVSANTWIVAMVRRSGGNVSIHSVPMGSTSLTSSGTAAMSAASDGLGFHFGTRQDNNDNQFEGSMSDAIFIPGTAVPTSDLQDIATSTPLDSFSWWGSREFHGIFSTVSSESDNTGNHTITKTGTPPFIADPTQLVRSGASEWVAAGNGAASLDAGAAGDNLAVVYSAGNYHSIADAAGMTLPNSDWTWLLTIKAPDVTTAQDILINGVYHATNTLNLYINAGNFALDISALGTDEIVPAVVDTWYLLAIVRSSNNFTLRAIPFGTSTVANSGAGTAISAAYDSTTGYKFGINTDLSSFPALDVAMGDVVFIPGSAVSDSEMIDIANGTGLSSFSWWGSREFHLIASDGDDHTGNHTVTTTGAPNITTGPAEFVRFGNVELVAAGVGGFSGISNALSLADLNASGAGNTALNITALLQTDLSADGVGTYDALANAAFLADLNASGVGGAAIFSANDKADLSADGIGLTNLDAQFNKPSDLSAAGLSTFTAQAAGVQIAELLAQGLGGATFSLRSSTKLVTIPGSNMFIIANNAINRAATLTATTTAAGFDVGNIKTDRKSSVWRSTAVTSQTITATWTDSETISGLGLAFTNLIEDSTVQLKLYTNTGDPSPVYDSGVQDVDFSYDPPTGFSTIGLDSFAFGGGNYFSYLLSSMVTAKKLELILISPGNPDGFIEISRVVSGFAYTPTIGASYELPVNYLDNTEISITDAGDTIANRGTIKKTMSISLNVLKTMDKAGLTQVSLNRGRGLPVFASIYENSETPEEKLTHTIYGTFDTLPGQSIKFKDTYGSQFTITEI